MNHNVLRGLGETPPAGPLLNGADNVLVKGNQAHYNGSYGFDLIAGSANDRFMGNDLRRNPRALQVRRRLGPKLRHGQRARPVRSLLTSLERPV